MCPDELVPVEVRGGTFHIQGSANVRILRVLVSILRARRRRMVRGGTFPIQGSAGIPILRRILHRAAVTRCCRLAVSSSSSSAAAEATNSFSRIFQCRRYCRTISRILSRHTETCASCPHPPAFLPSSAIGSSRHPHACHSRRPSFIFWGVLMYVISGIYLEGRSKGIGVDVGGANGRYGMASLLVECVFVFEYFMRERVGGDR